MLTPVQLGRYDQIVPVPTEFPDGLAQEFLCSTSGISFCLMIPSYRNRTGSTVDSLGYTARLLTESKKLTPAA